MLTCRPTSLSVSEPFRVVDPLLGSRRCVRHIRSIGLSVRVPNQLSTPSQTKGGFTQAQVGKDVERVITLLNEAGFRGDVIERQLAHQERNNVRASYNHADYMSERKNMMQQWADMIDEIVTSGPNKVLPFVRPITQQAE
jgi:hypothetical protein